MSKLTDFKPQRKNSNKHTPRGLSALEQSIQADGWIGAITVAADGETFDDSARIEVGAATGFEDAIVVESDGSKPVVVKRVDIATADDPRAKRLGYAANRVPSLNLAWDETQLLTDIEAGLDLSHLFDTQALTQALTDALQEQDRATTEETQALRRGDVPDALWATDNDWGVPLLDTNKQADAVDLPVRVWNGSGGRGKAKAGTWHFYTTDDRFNALWDDPSPVVNSGPVNIVEPNFSCWLDMPRAFGLFQIYRKRWLARYWQSKGIRVFVDLNVAPPFYDLNLLGVPHGWRAYATRGYTDRLDYIDQEHAQACERAGGSDVLFLVCGGGKAVKARCQERGWVWVAEDMDRAKGREVAQDA